MHSAQRVLRTERSLREEGKIILIAVLLLSLLAALATAQFTVMHRNIRSSNFYTDHTALRECAESGVSLGIHDLRYNASGNSGKIGCLSWTTGNDYGRDGVANTSDEGEGDGYPTPGEPNVAAVTIGPSDLGARFVTYVGPTAFPNVSVLVATATNNEAMVTVTTYVRKTVVTIPKLGAMYVDPKVALDLKGNKFSVDGRDHDADGNLVDGATPVNGISTLTGDPAGSNTTNLLSQINPLNYDQIVGQGTNPSVGEVDGDLLESVFNNFAAMKDNTLTPGTYTDPTMGTLAAPKITYVKGDIHLSGSGNGAGILLVDGSVEISGTLDFKGLVIVLGDVKLTGGGAGIHVYGSMMVGESLTAIDLTSNDVTLSGNADVYYSSEVLSKIEANLVPTYSIAYYDDK